MAYLEAPKGPLVPLHLISILLLASGLKEAASGRASACGTSSDLTMCGFPPAPLIGTSLR